MQERNHFVRKLGFLKKKHEGKIKSRMETSTRKADKKQRKQTKMIKQRKDAGTKRKR